MLKTKFFFPVLTAFVIIGLVLVGFGCNGSGNSGVYKSIDGGETWQHLSSKEEGTTLLPPFEVTALTSDRVFTSTIYVGSKNKGIFKTTDGGQNWQAINSGLPKDGKGLKVTAIALDQLSSETVYLACFHDKYGRIYRSEDSGGSWTETYAESTKNAKVLTLAADPINGGVLYVGTSEGGILKSTSYGESWNALKWFEKKEITCLTVDLNDPQVVYAGTDKDLGVIKSSDGGKTWKETGAKDEKQVTYATSKKNFRINTVVIDPQNSKRVYAGTDKGIYLSKNSGDDWELVNTLMPPKSGGVFAIAVSPMQSEVIFFSTEKIIYRSVNEGESWETSKLETPGHVSFLVIDSSNPQTIYIGIGELQAAKKGPLF
ncbi:hypothetical protein E3J85_00190 [Patescibacteria group bacterium]|nr:MAG: hypothetical protein E3J85_00190 [Patescibacteria group bacterium]